ncbi:endonuclease MutS2 [Thermosulfuriphilus sp.]
MKQETLAKLEFGEVCRLIAALTSSPLGQKVAFSLQPETTFPAARQALIYTQEAIKLLEEGISPEVEGLVPLDDFLAKISRPGGIPHPRELHFLRLALRRALGVRKQFGPLKRKAPGLYHLSRALAPLKDLSSYLDALLNEKGDNLRDSASQLLKRIRQEKTGLEIRIREAMRACLKKAAQRGLLQEELITVRNGRYVLPIRAEARGALRGILQDVSQSGATVYIEPLEVVELTNELHRLGHEEEREIERLLTQAGERIRPHLPDIRTDLSILGEFDLIFAKARWGQKIKGSVPKLYEQGDICLKGAVHPLLLIRDGQRAVRNDFLFPQDQATVLITGPNMGGKTVALKTVGLLVLMAQAGIPIPAAQDSELPFFSNLLVDIGDEQDLSEDQSTFSAHLLRLKEFLSLARKGILILIDEIGRGTDPAEGAALGMAVLDQFRHQGAWTIATSHYEALKAYGLQNPAVLPVSVGFNEQTGCPTYRLIYGLSGRSRAFDLAVALGLPLEILEQAANYLSNNGEEIDSLLSALEQERTALAQKQKELEELKVGLERDRLRLQAQKHQLEEERRHLQEAFERRLRHFLEKTSQEFKAWLRTLERRRVSPEKIRASYQTLAREWQQEARGQMAVLGLKKETSFSPGQGDPVYITSLGRGGICLKIEGDKALVQVGLFKTEVPIGDLAPPQEDMGPGPLPLEGEGWRVRSQEPSEVPSRLNVIGLTVDEALPLIDQVLDRAFVSGRPQLTIVHGIGTGRLAKAIKEHLKRHRQVAGFRSGERHEGGAGVTVVELALGGN